MADYDWFDHETPTKAKELGEYWRAQGLHPVYKDAHTMGGQPLYLDHYNCRRGCGCKVWNPQEHITNVCREWNPVVGKD